MSCPKCKAPDVGIAGYRFKCGSYIAWAGVTQTSECRRVEKILNSNKGGK